MIRAFVAIAAFLLVGLLIPQTGIAQDSVGKAIVDGKTVTLYSDNTWKYDTVSGETGCNQITVKLSFCGDVNRWRPSKNVTSDIAATYSHNASTLGLMVIEDIGTSAGIGMEFMRRMVLQAAEAEAGNKPVMLGIETDSFQGQDIETIVFQISLNDVKIVFATSVYLTEGTAAQITTYEISAEYTDAHKAAHAEFLAATRIEG